MKNKIHLLFIIFICLVFTSVNRCQEDFDFASRATASPTETPTATPSPDTSPSPDDASPTPTSSPDDEEEEGEEEEEIFPSPSPEESSSPLSLTVGERFIGGLRDLSAEQKAQQQAERGTNANSVERGIDDFQKRFAENQKKIGQLGSKPLSIEQLSNDAPKIDPENWLGSSYLSDEDRDGDGFSDQLEHDSHSEGDNAESIPEGVVTDLFARMGIDRDLDGITNDKELALGTDPNNADSDGDGFRDGSEQRSGSDPLSADDRPIDSDGDGLGDQYELRVGINSNNPDTDGDGLDDEMEIIISSDPHALDTDRDGILDGREFALGSDPILPEILVNS